MPPLVHQRLLHLPHGRLQQLLHQHQHLLLSSQASTRPLTARSRRAGYGAHGPHCLTAETAEAGGPSPRQQEATWPWTDLGGNSSVINCNFYHPAQAGSLRRASSERAAHLDARRHALAGNHRALNVNGVLNRPPQSKPEDRGNAFESKVARSSARSAASAETEAPPIGGSQCGRREPMGVTTWATSFVVYTELRLDAYESNATRGVIKMITHAATGCSKWDSASL